MKFYSRFLFTIIAQLIVAASWASDVTTDSPGGSTRRVLNLNSSQTAPDYIPVNSNNLPQATTATQSPDDAKYMLRDGTTTGCADAFKKTYRMCDNFMDTLGADQKGFLATVLSQSAIQTAGAVATPLLGAVAASFGGDIRRTCEMTRALTATMTALNGSYAAGCSWAYRSCVSTCNDEAAGKVKNIADANENAGNRCRNMGEKVYGAISQASLAANTMLGAQACVTLAEDAQTSSNNNDLCSRSENRNSPVCTGLAMDCSQAANANNCYCILRANPSDARCAGVASNANSLNGDYFGNSTTANTTGLDDLMVDNDTAPKAVAPTASTAGVEGGGAAPGGPAMAPSGGGSGANAQTASAGNEKGPFNTDIDHGSGRRGSIATISGAGNQMPNYGGDNGNGRKNNEPDFDLRKFLPKTNPNLAQNQRNIAGMTISATDGKTGPLTNIFIKVSNRYGKVSSSLKN